MNVVSGFASSCGVIPEKKYYITALLFFFYLIIKKQNFKRLIPHVSVVLDKNCSRIHFVFFVPLQIK